MQDDMILDELMKIYGADEEERGSLVYIPLDQIYPHPDNPRKELGDLTELADSIKSKGIMQNLTVVSRAEGGYTVIIGHRRSAAAKLAGLDTVPCIIVEQLIKKHEGKRMDELSAFAGAVDANWLYTLHTDPHLRFGKKRLRRVWEAMVRNRIAFREFYRDGHGAYVEQPTGQNVEDEVTVKELLGIGVDIRAWEREEIHFDRETGEVTFDGGC